MADSAKCLAQGAMETAKFFLLEGIEQFPQKTKLWNSLVKIEEDYGSAESVGKTLSEAMERSGKTLFVLRYSKHLWKKMEQPEEAYRVLAKKYQEDGGQEAVLLALQKMARELKMFEEAEQLLVAGLEKHPESERVAIQAAQLQRQMGRSLKALEHAEAGIAKFPKCAKLWLIKCHVHQHLHHFEQARDTYDEALQVPEIRKQPLVWLCAADFEREQKTLTRARTLLQKARVKILNEPQIWVASIELEIHAGNAKIAANLCSQALQKFPSCGKLWAIAIRLEPASTKKTKSADALRKMDSSPWVFLEIAKTFWSEQKMAQARKFIAQAINLDRDNGDFWGYAVKMTVGRQGQGGQSEDDLHDLLKDFKKADPCHGEVWPKFFKQVANWNRPKVELI